MSLFLPPASYDDGGSSSLKQLRSLLKVAYQTDSCGDDTKFDFLGLKHRGVLFLQEDELKKRIQTIAPCYVDVDDISFA